MVKHDQNRKLVAEALGTCFLLMTVVGSGIMAENLAGGNEALALLGNTLPTGAILVVLIIWFGPISGAHFKSTTSWHLSVSILVVIANSALMRQNFFLRSM